LPLAPQAPQLESPCRQRLLFAVPFPNYPLGTTPPITSAFAASPVSTYCLVDA
jgi:hypothetical protein